MPSIRNIARFIGISLLLLPVAYIVDLRLLSMEGNRIFEYRCQHVNPNLIAYKTKFLRFADHVNNPEWASVDQMADYFISYLTHMEAYVAAEDQWLEMDRKFISRPDFRIIEPWYMKKAAELQRNMYMGYRDDAAYLLAIARNPDILGDAIPGPGDVSEARRKRDDAIQEYFDFYEEVSEIGDWRKLIMYLPVPEGCTEENMTFPDTAGSIKWEEGQEATPSGIPIDPYLTV